MSVDISTSLEEQIARIPAKLTPILRFTEQLRDKHLANGDKEVADLLGGALDSLNTVLVWHKDRTTKGTGSDRYIAMSLMSASIAIGTLQPAYFNTPVADAFKVALEEIEAAKELYQRSSDLTSVKTSRRRRMSDAPQAGQNSTTKAPTKSLGFGEILRSIWKTFTGK